MLSRNRFFGPQLMMSAFVSAFRQNCKKKTSNYIENNYSKIYHNIAYFIYLLNIIAITTSFVSLYVYMYVCASIIQAVQKYVPDNIIFITITFILHQRCITTV